MAKGPERKIEDWFVAGMTRHRYMNKKGDDAAEKNAGWSDREFYGHGPRTIFVEFKRDGAPKKRRGEKLQNYVRAQLRKRGYETYLVRGWAEAYKVFGEITGEIYEYRGVRGKARADKVVDLAAARKRGRVHDRRGRNDRGSRRVHGDRREAVPRRGVR